jgi:hypothetical protein
MALRRTQLAGSTAGLLESTLETTFVLSFSSIPYQYPILMYAALAAQEDSNVLEMLFAQLSLPSNSL